MIEQLPAFNDSLFVNIDAVTSISIDSCSIWYGTMGGGVVRYFPMLNVRLLYTTQNGLNSNKIVDLIVDGLYVWVATDTAIIRFDKFRTDWEVIELNASINCIAVDKDNVWVGTTTGLYRYDIINHTWVMAPTYNINAIVIDKYTGNVLVATDNGMGIYHRRGAPFDWTLLTIADGLSSNRVNCIAVDKESIWIGTDNGLCRYLRGNGWEIFTTANTPFITNNISAISRAYDETHNLLAVATVAACKVTVYDLTGRRWVSYTLPTKFATVNNITAIEISGNILGTPTIWLATDNCGLIYFRYLSNMWEAVTTTNGIVANEITTICIDSMAGTIWFGTTAGLSQYSITTMAWHSFSCVDVLPGEIVTGIACISDAVWIATNNGVGTYSRANNSWEYHYAYQPCQYGAGSLPSNNTHDIAVAIIENVTIIWVATDQGVAYYRNRCWYTINISEGLISNYVNCIAVDTDSIWFGTDSGISRYFYNDDRWQNFTTANGLIDNYINAIYIDDDVVWVGTMQGLSIYYKSYNVWINYTTAQGLLSNHITCITTVLDENMVFIGTPKGLSVYREYQGFESYTIADGLNSNNIRALVTLLPGTYGYVEIDEPIVYIGTDAGVARYDLAGEPWTIYTTANGLAANDVRQVTVDPYTEKVWVGAYGGVSIYDKGTDTWEIVTADNGLTNNFVYDIKIERDTVWVGTDGGGVNFYNKSTGSWHAFMPEDGLAAEDVLSIEIDYYDNLLWFGTDGGVSAYNPATGDWITYTSADGLADDWIWEVEARATEVWFATNAGLSCYNKSTGSWRTFTTTDGLPHDIVYCIEFIDNTLWIGTGGGACYYEPATAEWHTWTPATTGLPHEQVYDILAGANAIWFATCGGGIAKYDMINGTWTVFTIEDGLVNNFVHSLVWDGTFLWAGTNGGVARYNLEPTDAFLHSQSWIVEDYLPELILDANSVQLSDMLPIENKLLTITVNIYNNGKLPALATQLAVYEGDPFGVIEYVRIAEVNCSISGYSNVTLTMNWTPTRGEHNLWFIIDPYQTVPELNKANNRVTIVLFVAEIPSKPPAQEIDWLNIYLIVIYGAIAGSIIFVCVYIMLRTIYRIRRRTRR